MGLVSGKVALVTGAGAGIGRAAALKFAEEGAKVVVSNLNGDGGSETVALIRQKAGDAIFVRADVTEAAEVEALIASAVVAFGRLDCACNNAGNRRQNRSSGRASGRGFRPGHVGECQGHLPLPQVMRSIGW